MNDICIIGAGPSGVCAAKALVPKYITGVPTDRWSGFIARRLTLPTPWVRTHRRSQQRYVDSHRYTPEVDDREHARALQRDLVARAAAPAS